MWSVWARRSPEKRISLRNQFRATEMFKNRLILWLVLADLVWLCLSEANREHDEFTPEFGETGDLQTNGDRHYGEITAHSKPHPGQPSNKEGRRLKVCGKLKGCPKLPKICSNYYFKCLSRNGNNLGEICVTYSLKMYRGCPRCMPDIYDMNDIRYRCRDKIHPDSFNIERTQTKCWAIITAFRTNYL